jgi:hypothetical protein
MVTTTLTKAFDLLQALPADMQEEIGSELVSYTKRWDALKTSITTGTGELARGEGIAISDIDTFAEKITKKHDLS